jgi:hypothetical protein
LYKYPEYLHKNKIFVGNINEVEKIDYDFAEFIKEDGGQYLGIAYMNVNGYPLGFLGVVYHDSINVPSKIVIKDKLQEYSKIISELLDLQSQTNEN